MVGVDIGPDFVRVVEIDQDEGGIYRLVNLGMAPTPEGALEDGVIVAPREVGRAIRGLFRERGIRSRQVVAALRGPAAIARIISLPSMAHQRLKKLIESEINRYAQFGSGDKVIYYHPLEEFDEENRRKVNVLLVAARRELCDSYHRAFREAGLEVAGMDMSLFCALRVLRNSITDFPVTNVMSLVFDHNFVGVNIFHGDTMRFFRVLQTGSVETISTSNGFIDRLSSEILMAMHYYQNEYIRGEEISRVVMTLGGGAGREIYDCLVERLGDVPLMLHAPFSNIRVHLEDFPQELIEKVDYSFITAVGLALRGQELQALPFQVDLLPAEVAEAKVLTREAKVFAVVLMLFVLAMVLFGSYLQIKKQNLESDVKQLEAHNTQLDLSIKRLEQAQIGSLKMETMTVAGALTPQWTRLFEKVKEIIPRDVQLISMELHQPGSVVFDGVADSDPAIYYFLASLTRSEIFSAPELGPRQQVTVSGHKMVQFRIHCRYKLP
ncbi:MAG: pilus assembly protein PilM [bacterium]